MNNFHGKNVVITGGMGFIGSNLARSLVLAGAKVTLVDSMIPEYGGNLANVSDLNGKLNINYCDVRDEFALRPILSGVDYLFNLAGQTSHLDSMIDPQTDLAINASAQLSILNACREVCPQVRIVFASTRQLYGKPQYLPVDEKHPIVPVDVNGINKLAGEYYHLLYSRVYGLRSCALRLTNTYGPGMRVRDARQTFLGIWINNLLSNRAIQIFGDGEQLRDFNYVDDCVDALMLVAVNEKSDGKIYNLGSDEVVSLLQLAQMMTELGHGGVYECIPFPADRKAIDIGDYYSDFTLIKSELGWKPKMRLAEGLKKTVDFYSSHLKQYA